MGATTSVTRLWRKRSPTFPKVYTTGFTQKVLFCKTSPKPQNIWATFVRKFFVKYFQKSPNLVTQVLTWRIKVIDWSKHISARSYILYRQIHLKHLTGLGEDWSLSEDTSDDKISRKCVAAIISLDERSSSSSSSDHRGNDFIIKISRRST